MIIACSGWRNGSYILFLLLPVVGRRSRHWSCRCCWWWWSFNKNSINGRRDAHWSPHCHLLAPSETWRELDDRMAARSDHPQSIHLFVGCRRRCWFRSRNFEFPSVTLARTASFATACVFVQNRRQAREFVLLLLFHWKECNNSKFYFAFHRARPPSSDGCCQPTRQTDREEIIVRVEIKSTHRRTAAIRCCSIQLHFYEWEYCTSVAAPTAPFDDNGDGDTMPECAREYSECQGSFAKWRNSLGGSVCRVVF